jgi:hypothetical protein
MGRLRLTRSPLCDKIGERQGRFYLHIKAGTEVFQDEEGAELPSVDAARNEAVKTARELLCLAIRAGKATIPEAVVIADETGEPLEVVPLAAVLPEPLRR